MLFYAPGKLLWIISRESDGRGIWNAKKEKKTTQMSLNYIKGIICGLVEEFEMSRKKHWPLKGTDKLGIC